MASRPTSGNCAGSDVTDTILQVDNLALSFGGVHALTDVSLAVTAGALVSIIGPNGAGKTSLLNCISGRYRPRHGRIAFAGNDLTHLSPSARAAFGISRTFQNLALFSHLSVIDNILIGRHRRFRPNVLLDGLFWGPSRRREVIAREEVETIIDLLELQPLRHRIAGTLAYGQQKKIELARALAMKPRLLLLDEPMAGMTLTEKEDMSKYILHINRSTGITIVMIEHDMRVVMDLSEHITVLSFGRVIARGNPEEIVANPEVQRSYLGDPDMFDNIAKGRAL